MSMPAIFDKILCTIVTVLVLILIGALLWLGSLAMSQVYLEMKLKQNDLLVQQCDLLGMHYIVNDSGYVECVKSLK